MVYYNEQLVLQTWKLQSMNSVPSYMSSEKRSSIKNSSVSFCIKNVEQFNLLFIDRKFLIGVFSVQGIFDSDWYTSRSLIGRADIIVIKYSVNDKTLFQEIKDSYVPMIKKALNHCSVPVIISAVGARKNGMYPVSCRNS